MPEKLSHKGREFTVRDLDTEPLSKAEAELQTQHMVRDKIGLASDEARRQARTRDFDGNFYRKWGGQFVARSNEPEDEENTDLFDHY